MSLTDEQRVMRRSGIGASEIAAVAGLSPFASPLDVWRSKVEGLVLEETPAMKRGRLLEPAVAEWYAEETGATLIQPPTLRHAKHAFALATPDRIATLRDDERVLEIKTTNLHNIGQWGEPGTDHVPQAYLVQVAWEMAVADLPHADLAVLIAGDDFRIYRFERDAELESMLLDVGGRFWRDNVEARRPPELDGSEACFNWLNSRFPKETGPAVPADAEAERWAAQYREAGEMEATAKERKQEARNHLQALIGEAAGMVGDGWKLSWKARKTTTETDWEALALRFKPAPEMIAAHTKEKAGPRVFRLTVNGGSNHD